jgi:hypothetical protein
MHFKASPEAHVELFTMHFVIVIINLHWFVTLLFLNIEDKPIPTELRSDEAELRKAIEFDDQAHESKFVLLTVLILARREF